MKNSPLRLDWIRYGEAAYRTLVDAQDSDAPVPVAITQATVRFNENGQHAAFLRVEHASEPAPAVYEFHVEVIAAFGLEVDVARAEYRQPDTASLVPVVAVNMSRILFASAREFLSMLTSRAPMGPLVLESVLLEPGDITIVSDLDPPGILERVFKAPDEEVEQFRQHWEARRQEVQSELGTAPS